MTRARRFFPITLVALLAWLAPDARAGDGRQLFLKHECNECHSIQVENVEVVESDEDEEEVEDDLDLGFDDEGEEVEEEEIDPPDLSGVGKRHEAAWMAKFVTKKVETDEGKKHRKRFKGTDQELTELVSYLSSLKTDAPAGEED